MPLSFFCLANLLFAAIDCALCHSCQRAARKAGERKRNALVVSDELTLGRVIEVGRLGAGVKVASPSLATLGARSVEPLCTHSLNLNRKKGRGERTPFPISSL